MADRWADLAVASMSLDWNYGPGWQDEFFHAYGIERDEERIQRFRALSDAAPLRLVVCPPQSPRSSSASSRARSRPTSSSKTSGSSRSSDIAPKAPVHLLVVPKTAEYANVAELAAGDPQLLADIVARGARARRRAHRRRVPPRSSTPASSVGQTVFHVHAHVLERRT